MKRKLGHHLLIFPPLLLLPPLDEKKKGRHGGAAREETRVSKQDFLPRSPSIYRRARSLTASNSTSQSLKSRLTIPRFSINKISRRLTVDVIVRSPKISVIITSEFEKMHG